MLLSSLVAASSGLIGLCNARSQVQSISRSSNLESVAQVPGCNNIKPQGYTCGTTGSVTSPGQVSSNPGLAANFVACTKACLSEKSCASFSFEQGVSCVFYSRLIKNMGFSASSASKNQFFSRACFSGSGCPTPANCPVNGGPANQNPILQPGAFESATWGCWKLCEPCTSNGSTYGVVAPGNKNSKYAGELYLPTNNDDTAVGLAYNYSHFTVGQVYTMSIDLKMSDTQCAVIMYSNWGQQFAFGQYNPGDYAIIPPGSGWFTFTQTTIPFSTASEFGLSADCIGNPHDGPETTIRYQVDNVKIEKTGNVIYTPASKPVGPNMIVNGDFATKKLAPFYKETPQGQEAPTTARYNAKYKAAQLTLTNGADGSTLELDQDLTTIKDAVYSFSVEFMYEQNVGTPDPNNGCSAYFNFVNKPQHVGNAPIANLGDPSNPGAGPGKWVTLKGVNTASSNADTLAFGAYCIGNSASEQATFYFRNIQMYPLTK